MSNESPMGVSTGGTISILHANLTDRYKDYFCIIQELLQNADDAKASHVHFGVSLGLDVNHPLGRLPALYVMNDGPVSRSNLEAIYTVASGDKGNEKNKIGKFGLGMKSVFHVCEGFFMFGHGMEEDLSFPRFCTPWTKEYHEDWYVGLDDAKSRMDGTVRDYVKDIVADWERWFCVWLPLRTESLHVRNRTSPIIQMYPTTSDLDAFTGLEYASQAAHLLPLMKHVEHLSFVDRHGALRRFDLEGASRMQGETGRFSGTVRATGDGLADFSYSGVEKKICGGVFEHLRSLPCWPRYTQFVTGKGLENFPDKTDSHVAVCFLSEASTDPSLSVVPCVYLPLSEVREHKAEYMKPQIGGERSITIYLHGSLFVDAGRQGFSINEPLGHDPVTETELRAEWNRCVYEDGILPLVVPELFSAFQGWDDKTICAVMGALCKVPFFGKWADCVCRSEGIARELTAEGYKWARINSADMVFSIDPPRSPTVREVIASALPAGCHVIDGTAGRLLKRDRVRNEFSSDISERMLRATVALDPEKSDNEVLRQFAQSCAEQVEIGRLDEAVRSARIWKTGDGVRHSYNELLELSECCRLYCHAEGTLRELFCTAVVDDTSIQVNEPLAKALRLDIPDFTEDFILGLLQNGPKLNDVDSRCKLLERFLHMRHDPANARWVKACRYLIHGESKLLDCLDLIYMPLDGAFHDFSVKVVDVLSRRRYGVSCRIPRALTDILDKPRREELKLQLSTPDDLVRELAGVRDRLRNDEFDADDWQELVMMVQNPFEQEDVKRALRHIPLYPTEDGQWTALDAANAFYEDDDYRVAQQLRPFVRILKIDGEERLVKRMRRLARKWDSSACIDFTDRYLGNNLSEFTQVIVAALKNAEKKAKGIEEAVGERLRKKAWIRMLDGRVLAPQSIMNLSCVSGLVPGCDTIGEVADHEIVEVVRPYALFLGEHDSVDHLFDMMSKASDGRYALGELRILEGQWDSDFADAVCNHLQDVLPVVAVLRKLRDAHVLFQGQMAKLCTALDVNVLVKVLTLLTNKTGNEMEPDEALWELLCLYLNEAARRTDFMSAIMPRLLFRDKRGRLKNPSELCVDMTGVPDSCILNDAYLKASDFRRSITGTVENRKNAGEEKQMSLCDYFSTWDNNFDDRIAGFIICCTDQPDEIKLVRSRFGFGSKSVAESRKSVANELRDLLRNQHCYVRAVSDDVVHTVAIDGTEMPVSVTPLASSLNLFCGQSKVCERVRNSTLWYMGKPPKPDGDFSLILRLRKPSRETLSSLSPQQLDNLLVHTLKEIITSYGLGESDVASYWESLKNAEQLDVRVTKSVILQSLGLYLSQIRCKDERIKTVLKDCQSSMYGEEQARVNGDRSGEASYRDKRTELHRDLERMIVEDVGVQHSVLEALRERVREYSYNVDSILFELFQNADDAYEEMIQLCGGALHDRPDRFDVRFDGNRLIVVHWGRPINQTKVGAEQNPKFEDYRFDLQKMILLSQSGKTVEGVQTKGLYGLGFKSVFLVCDTPCVLSGRLRFKIVGGLLPEPLGDSEAETVDDTLRTFENVPSRVKPTVFILPLRNEIREEVAKGVRHFAQEAEILGLFARHIRRINVEEADGTRTEVNLGHDGDGASSVRACGQKGSFLRMDVNEATLLVGVENDLPVPLPPEVATYWVMCPTSVKAGLGVALNANLKLDTGRLILDPKATQNEKQLAEAADAFYVTLSKWEESLSDGVRYEMLHALFSAFTGGKDFRNWDESHADAKALRIVLWSPHGAYRRLLETQAAVPSGLEGAYRSLCKLGDVAWMVDADVISSGLIETVGCDLFEPGRVVAKEWFCGVGKVFFPDVMSRISSYDTMRLLSDLALQNSVLSPDWCNAHAEQLYGLVKQKLEQEDIRKSVRKFEFETKGGAGCTPGELLIEEDEDEQLRAKFLPPDHVLSPAYGVEARKLVKLFRCDAYIRAEELAAFALEATASDKRESVVRYLSEGHPSEAFLAVLRKGRKGSWLEDWKHYGDKETLGLRGLCQVAVALSSNDAAFEGQIGGLDFGVPHEDVRAAGLPVQLPSLVEVHDWWTEHREEGLRAYNQEVYGRDFVELLTFDCTSPLSRSSWMEVLVLGAAHRMGFKLCQHKGFIAFLKRKGWWDEYCRNQVEPKQWMKTLDQCLEEEEFARGEYRHWFGLFVRIYQFSKHLDDYVNLFETWNDMAACEKCDLVSVKENSKLRGTGIDAPGLQYALGEQTGLSFVCREMVRRGAIRNPLLHRFCFVPYPPVSEFCSFLRDSEAMFDKAVHELGEEKATFDLAFDIALTSYLKIRR